MLGILLCLMERFEMAVRALMAKNPSSFRCFYEMPSGLTEDVGFICSIICFVKLGVKGGGGMF